MSVRSCLIRKLVWVIRNQRSEERIIFGTKWVVLRGLEERE